MKLRVISDGRLHINKMVGGSPTNSKQKAPTRKKKKKK